MMDTVGRKRTANKDLPRHLQCKNGWYHHVIYINDKPIWNTLGTQDKGLALQRWATIEAQLEAQLNARFTESMDSFDINKPKKRRRLFKELAEEYLEETTSQKAKNTQRSEIPRIKLLVERFGNLWADKIERQDVILYHRELKDIPYEANRRVALISHMLQCARDWGYVKFNVADRIKKYKENKIKLTLTPDILFHQIYPSAKPMLKRAIMLAWHLVQHENEIKKLKWTDINTEKLNVSFVREKTGIEISVDYSQNETFRAYLQYLLSIRKELCPYVVCHESPRGWRRYESFKSMWKKALKSSGLQGIMFKEIRHLANDTLEQRGVHVRNRMAMTGHQTIQANEKYTHRSGEDSKICGEHLSNYSPSVF